MSIIIKPLSVDKIKEIIVKILLSRTDKVTKVSDGSVLSGTAYGNAKVGQKALKDIALGQSHFYPDTAYGIYLDNIASMYGISPRFGALGSSTYVRVVANVGTTYVAGTHTFKSTTGIVFDIANNVTVGNDGFAYILVTSQTAGQNTNVEASTIDSVTPIPSGHQYVTNEYSCLNGRDVETDDQFRNRIKSAINVLARPTLQYILQVFLKYTPNVLRVFNYGATTNGKIRLGIATQDGSNLNNIQLNSMLSQLAPWLSLSELNPDGLNNVGVELVNIQWEPIDVSFRCDIDPSYNADKVRINAQIKMNKYMDYRTWIPGSTVQWDDLLQIAKTTEGIRYVPDQYFYPSQDLSTDYGKLPRIRGFLMLDLDGNVISSGSNNLNPVFYPTVADFSFISTVLANL